jgi:proline utilization trans-activator
MTGPSAKPERQPAPRKRALVSCDRCKLRRVRCIRLNPDEACSDCTANGTLCESKLPRKQRVYGSVETLSFRFRALESLVQGLFPNERVSDTNTLFKIAATRNIAMPTANDLGLQEPAAIFSDKEQQPHTKPHSSVSADKFHPDSSIPRRPNPLDDVPSIPPSETLMPDFHGDSLYVGSTSYFKMAITIRSLVARCNANPEARALLRRSTSNESTFEIPQPNQNRVEIPSKKRPSTRDFDENASSQFTGTLQERKRARVEMDKLLGKSHAKENTYSTLEDFLPSRSVADALVQTYFDDVHLLYPVFQKNLFFQSYYATFSRRHEQLSDQNDGGWLCCLALVFAFGARGLMSYDQEKAVELKRKYIRFVRADFWPIMNNTSLTNGGLHPHPHWTSFYPYSFVF